MVESFALEKKRLMGGPLDLPAKISNGNGPSDSELIGEVLGGRRESYHHLVRRYERLVRVAVWNFFRSASHSDDVCQEVFLKAFLNLSELVDPGRFRPWLLRIACRTCIDVKRRLHPGEELVFDFQEAWVPEDPGAVEHFAAAEVKSLLSSLSPADGIIIWLKYVEGYGYEDIATMVGANGTAIRKRASRAMKSLRERFRP